MEPFIHAHITNVIPIHKHIHSARLNAATTKCQSTKHNKAHSQPTLFVRMMREA